MGGKKGRQAAQKTVKSDFTLNDFANANPAVAKTGRMKKGEANAWNVEAKELECEGSEKRKEDLAWDEKDLSDFEITDADDATAAQPEQEKAAEKSVCSRTRRRHRFASPAKIVEDDEHGFVYPLDLWFLLSRYIHPTDIGRFSRICQGTHSVVHSAMFWYQLYNRYYNSDIVLPQPLQKQCISRVHGLRTRVIRSLFFMYPPFKQRVTALAPLEKDPDVLTGKRCVIMWYKKLKGLWQFFFKFREVNSTPCPLAVTKMHDLQSDPSIHNNPEEGCCVLQVVASNFISLPVVMGMVLTKTFISVGHEMRFHKLKLIFNPEYNPSDRNILTNGTTLIIDPVVNVDVLHWWHPKYPHTT